MVDAPTDANYRPSRRAAQNHIESRQTSLFPFAQSDRNGTTTYPNCNYSFECKLRMKADSCFAHVARSSPAIKNNTPAQMMKKFIALEKCILMISN
jgi:hypothetical protein